MTADIFKKYMPLLIVYYGIVGNMKNTNGVEDRIMSTGGMGLGRFLVVDNSPAMILVGSGYKAVSPVEDKPGTYLYQGVEVKAAPGSLEIPDGRTYREIIKDYFSPAGQVTEAADINQAVALLLEQSIDVLFMGTEVGELDTATRTLFNTELGKLDVPPPELLVRYMIKQSEKGRKIRMVAMPYQDHVAPIPPYILEAAGSHRQVFDYIRKPFARQELSSFVPSKPSS